MEKKFNLLVLSELVEGGEWIALNRLFNAVKSYRPECSFSLIAFTKSYKPALAFYEYVKFLRYSSTAGIFGYIRGTLSNFVKMRTEIEKFLSTKQVDYILTSDYVSALAALSIRSKRAKVIFLFHGIRSIPVRSIADLDYRQIIVKFLEWLSWSISDAVAVPSEKTRDYVSSHSAIFRRSRDIYLIPNIVPSCFYSGVNNKKPGPAEKFLKYRLRVLYSGRLMGYKGIINIILAISMLVKEKLSVLLLIAYPTSSSEREIQNKARELVKRHNLKNNIIFVKDPSTRKLIGLYKTASVLILPSELENLPLSVLEGLALGVPVIATGVGDLPEIIAKVNPKMMLKSNSPEEIYQKLLMFSGYSEDKLEIMRSKSRATGRKYTEKPAVDAFLKVIKMLKS